MASIAWAVSGGRVVEIVDGQMRVTDISLADYDAGRLPYGEIHGEPFTLVPHQDSPTNFDVSTRVVPWVEAAYRGEPLPGVTAYGGYQYPLDPNEWGPEAPPDWWLHNIPRTPMPPPAPVGPGGIPMPQAATPTGVGVNTGTGAPKPLAYVIPSDSFIGGPMGEIRVVGPGPLVGADEGIRIGTLPRIVLRDQIAEGR